MKSLRLIATMTVLSATLVFAQGKGSASSIEARMDKVWAAWCTLDSKNAAPLYDQGADNVYYDVAPFEYKGFAAYAKGVEQVFAGAKNCKATISNKQVHRMGNGAWSTASADFSYTDAKGKKQAMKLRWTAIWKKQGNDWVVEHEHVSAPLPE